jgi:hypothetical protein
MGVSGNDVRLSERNSGRQGRMRPAIKGTATMRIRLDSIKPMLVAGTAAACPDVRQGDPAGAEGSGVVGGRLGGMIRNRDAD